MVIRNISYNGFSRKVVLSQNNFFFEHNRVQKKRMLAPGLSKIFSAKVCAGTWRASKDPERRR